MRRQLSFGAAFRARGRHYTTSFGEGTARAEVILLWGQRAVLRAARGSRGECAAVATVRTDVAWPSLVCWLVILIGAGSSEVGARSPVVDSLCVSGWLNKRYSTNERPRKRLQHALQLN